MKTGIEAFDGIPSWASTRSRYFASILKPEQPEQGAYVNIINATTACSGILSGPIKLKPNETINRQYMLYLGPNNADTISKLGISPSEITGYWVSNGITNMLLKIMRFFYNIFGNYGIAIIILTLLISTVMFPLTRKSLRSMKEMQKIQPEVEKIKKEYSNNQQKMNKEIMELYKKYKINPLGGCLPMLLQVPVFLSLFQALPRSLDLKDARFLWIKDLSAPDALFKLPTPLPILGNSVNILPITMALVMFIQQKISTPGGEVSDQQRMMATITPIMFGFFFYNISSGLVLYWLISTSYTLFMQEIVLKSRLSK
jgi:YidC/Oxa1 family membrane protein insertase